MDSRQREYGLCSWPPNYVPRRSACHQNQFLVAIYPHSCREVLETLMLPNQHEGLRIKSTELSRPPLAHAPQHHQMSWGHRLHPGPMATYWHPRVRCEHRWLERKPHTLECSEPKESSISFVKTLLPLRSSQRAQPWSAFFIFVFSGGEGEKSCQYFFI